MAGLAITASATARDALQEPALLSPLATQSLLLDMERAGERLIAVGERGHILLSADEAESWQQAPAPVRVTLTNVFFIDDQYGWAVGHDGVILKSEDGGNNWRKVMDGIQANQLMLEHAETRLSEFEAEFNRAPAKQQAAMEAELQDRTYMAQDAAAFAEEGPSRPFLDIWFKNRDEGIAVGAFGLILHTRDGGEHWSAWFDHLDNPSLLHLNAITQIGEHLFMAAEAGNLFRSDDWGESWETLMSPYDGSFFGITGTDQGRLIAYGLRGNAYQSTDWGDNWKTIDTGVDSTFFSGTLLEDDSVMLVGAAGTALQIDSRGRVINTHQHPARLPQSKVLPGQGNSVLIAGAHGVRKAPVSGGTQ